MKYLIPIFLLAFLGKVNSEAWTVTDPNQLFDDTDALTNDPTATSSTSSDDNVVQVSTMTDGAVVVTTIVYVIVGNRPVRTRTAYTLTQPTTATVTVTDYEGDTVVRTFTVSKKTHTGTVETTVPSSTNTVTVGPDQTSTSDSDAVTSFVSTVQSTDTVATVTTDSLPSTPTESVQPTSDDNLPNHVTRTRWIKSHTTTFSSTETLESTTSQEPRWRDRIVTYFRPTTTTVISTTEDTTTLVSTSTTSDTTTVTTTQSPTDTVLPTSTEASSITSLPINTDDAITITSVNPDGSSTTETLYPVTDTTSSVSSVSVITTVDPDGIITTMTMSTDTASVLPDQSTSTTSADVYTTTIGSITSVITLQPSSSESSTDSGSPTSTFSSKTVYVTTTQTIIRSVRPRTFTALRTNTMPFTTTLVLESPTTVISTVLSTTPITITRTAIRERTRILAPRTITRIPQPIISTVTNYVRKPITRFSAWPTTTTTTAVETTTQTQKVAPMTYVKSLPPQTITELEYRTYTATNYIPTIVRKDPITTTETLALVRLATTTITAAQGGVTVVTQTVPGTQIAITGTCIPKKLLDYDKYKRERVEHAKLCHEARLDILNKLTNACKSGSIDQTQLFSALPPTNDTTDLEDEDEDTTCFKDLINARDEVDPQTQQALLRTMYDKYCNQEFKSTTSTNSGSTTLSKQSNSVTNTGNAGTTATGQHRQSFSSWRARHGGNASSRTFSDQDIYGLYRTVSTTGTQSTMSTSTNDSNVVY